MTGIVGRLFREFAITLASPCGLGARFADAHADDVRAVAQSARTRSTAAFFQLTERFFNGMLDGYERGLHWVLAHQRLRSMVAAATLVATFCLYVFVPKGLLPQQDTGRDHGRHRCRAVHFLQGMVERVNARFRNRAAGSGRRERLVLRRRGHGERHGQHGRLYIKLKPRDQRSQRSEIIERLRDATRNGEGISLFMQAAQDVQIDSRVSRTQYQYTLQDADEAELADGRRNSCEKLGQRRN